MQTKTLINALEQFRDKAKGTRAKNGGYTGQKAVFDKAVGALVPYADLELEEALAALEGANKPKPRRSPPANGQKREAARSKKTPAINQALVQRYVTELEAAVSRGGFEITRPVLDRLSADKSVKAAEMKAICTAFVGSSATSRKAAHARIEQSIRSRILKR